MMSAVYVIECVHYITDHMCAHRSLQYVHAHRLMCVSSITGKYTVKHAMLSILHIGYAFCETLVY